MNRRSLNDISLKGLLIRQLREMHRFENQHAARLNTSLNRADDSVRDVLVVMSESSTVFTRMLENSLRLLGTTASEADSSEPRAMDSFGSEGTDLLQDERKAADKRVLEYGTARNAAEVLGETQLVSILEAILQGSASLASSLESRASFQQLESTVNGA